MGVRLIVEKTLVENNVSPMKNECIFMEKRNCMYAATWMSDPGRETLMGIQTNIWQSPVQ